MTQPFAAGNRCTIQLRDGSQCQSPAANEIRYPMCIPHAIRIVADVKAFVDETFPGGMDRVLAANTTD